MKYLEVKSLNRYQHYKERNMVWFKWHVDALQDYSFSRLSDSQKWIFIGMISLACKCNNRVPKDAEWIRKQISNAKSIEKDIETLIASGLLACLEDSASPIREDKIREEENRVEEKPAGNNETKALRFQQPTAEEVTEYAQSIGFRLDGGKFCDYYASKGWLVGKAPMKDWKAAVRTWKSKENESTPAPPKPKYKQITAAEWLDLKGYPLSSGTKIDGYEII